ncbi:hypothetical protein JB92DRAFT_199891 [Gautieria morchelliformis]|nr:hypothetical protein JB92DRAFT_199891 [Gautieria morchelliformis]
MRDSSHMWIARVMLSTCPCALLTTRNSSLSSSNMISSSPSKKAYIYIIINFDTALYSPPTCYLQCSYRRSSFNARVVSGSRETYGGSRLSQRPTWRWNSPCVSTYLLKLGIIVCCAFWYPELRRKIAGCTRNGIGPNSQIG